jgi:branched-chain amino acid transport system ATP-binding protein
MLLSIHNLNVFYAQTQILKEICLNVSGGEIIALLGPNGAGKSTVLKAIMHLGAPLHFKGEILFKGRNVAGLKPADLVNLGISFIPQGLSVFLELTVEENLKVALHNQPAAKGAISDSYARFPILAQKRQLKASSLSGGERHLLGLARALVTRPTLLLMDEPTAGLAPEPSQAVFRRLANLKAEGTGILLVEQKIKETLDLSDRVYLLKAGSLVGDGAPNDLIQDGVLMKAFFGGEHETTGHRQTAHDRAVPSARGPGELL